MLLDSLLGGLSDKLFPYPNGLPHLAQIFFGQLRVLLKYSAAVAIHKGRHTHIGSTVQPYLLVGVLGLLHRLYKHPKSALAGVIKIYRNMAIRHSQISDGLLFIGQRVFGPMGSQVNHCFKPSGGNVGKLLFGRLAPRWSTVR